MAPADPPTQVDDTQTELVAVKPQQQRQQYSPLQEKQMQMQAQQQ